MRKLLIGATLLVFGFSSGVHAEAVVSTSPTLEVVDEEAGYSIEVGGRLMMDYNRAELNGVVDEESFGRRRARLYVSGEAGNWGFKSQFNINDGSPEDLYIDYNGWDGARLRMGKQKMPFALEELISSKDISVLERSAITEQYAIGRKFGATISGGGSGMTYNFGAFDNDTSKDGEGNDFGFAGRVTASMGDTDAGLFHVGAAYKDDGTGFDAFGLEAAAVFGGFHIQAEYADGTQNDVDINGYYVQAGYVINGVRPYRSGIFRKVSPASSAGAWEIITRFESGNGDHSDIELGRTDADAYTIGLNYYLNSHVRIGVNYTDGDDNDTDDSGNEFRIRTQFTF